MGEKQTQNEKELKPKIAFGHYDHSGGLDEKTVLIVEKFIFTMKDVIDKDKDMRTGRGYNIDSSENVENSQLHIFKKLFENGNTDVSPKIIRENQCQKEFINNKVNDVP